MAMYQGSAIASITAKPSTMSLGSRAIERRSSISTGTITSRGMMIPTGPFIKKPSPRPTAARITNLRGLRSCSSVETSAAQIASVMQKVSGRSGSAIRPIEKYPKLVATIAPASRPVASSYQRRPTAAVTRTRPSAAIAAHRRAPNSLGPVTR